MVERTTIVTDVAPVAEESGKRGRVGKHRVQRVPPSLEPGGRSPQAAACPPSRGPLAQACGGQHRPDSAADGHQYGT
jgi:hypothetical protein